MRVTLAKLLKSDFTDSEPKESVKKKISVDKKTKSKVMENLNAVN